MLCRRYSAPGPRLMRQRVIGPAGGVAVQREDPHLLPVERPYLLVAEGYNGARPRLYRDGKLVWSSSTALATTFWPGARLANADRHE